VLASLAASRTGTLAAAGEGHTDALLGGYHLAFVVGALFALAAAFCATLLRTAEATSEEPVGRLATADCD
jgi:hypothetical protein